MLLSKRQRRIEKAVIEALAKELPLTSPFVVRTRRISRKMVEEEWGSKDVGPVSAWCWKEAGQFILEIDNRTPFHARIDCITHEYAHALDGHARRHHQHDDHGETWGVWYAKAYQVTERVVDSFASDRWGRARRF